MSGDASRLSRVLEDMAPVVVAVSGGVDSLTLAAFAHRLLPGRMIAAHAASPAVPRAAGDRVRELAAREGWRLEIVDAGEFDDPDYLRNPLNRCYFCKSCLYSSVDQLARREKAVVVSGSNTDDLSDFRPGLTAADEHSVRHPFIEAGIDKEGVRSLSRQLGLADIAELPASPCLSSRVETGLPVVAGRLAVVDAVEAEVRSTLGAETVRCRLTKSGVRIELDDAALGRLDGAATLVGRIEDRVSQAGLRGPVEFARYRRGSAFVGAKTAAQ
jgi:uncharacterized protein